MKRVVFFSVMTMMSAAGFAQRVLQTSTNTYLNEDNDHRDGSTDHFSAKALVK